MRNIFTSCALLCLSSFALANSEVAPIIRDDGNLLPSSLLQISETDAFSKYVFLVDKDKRSLSVFERDGEKIEKVVEYPADIGKNDGPKMKRNDKKTPEGIYFLGERLTQPEIPFDLYGGLAFTTDYPNFFDKIDNKTGSGIWLHAVPDSVPLNRGSRGCVVVRNDVIKKLADFVKLNETPILIFDKVSYISKDEHEKRRKSLGTFVEKWRNSWETQDIDTYMSFYADNFKAPGFNFASWKAHKQNLKKKYEFIKVTLSQPYIVQHNDQLVVKTLQRYESDKHIDYGVKTIYALRNGTDYKIVREEWLPFNRNAVTKAIANNAPVATAIESETN